MSGSKFVYVVRQDNTDFYIDRVELKELRNVSYYDWDADVEREDPLEFAIDNPDRFLPLVVDQDPEEGEYCEVVVVFSSRELAWHWVRLMRMQPIRDQHKDAPYIWRQRVGFCD